MHHDVDVSAASSRNASRENNLSCKQFVDKESRLFTNGTPHFNLRCKHDRQVRTVQL